MFGVGMAVERFWIVKLNWVQTLMALAGGLLMIKPGLTTDLFGLALIASVALWQRAQKREPLKVAQA